MTARARLGQVHELKRQYNADCSNPTDPNYVMNCLANVTVRTRTSLADPQTAACPTTSHLQRASLARL